MRDLCQLTNYNCTLDLANYCEHMSLSGNKLLLRSAWRVEQQSKFKSTASQKHTKPLYRFPFVLPHTQIPLASLFLLHPSAYLCTSYHRLHTRIRFTLSASISGRHNSSITEFSPSILTNLHAAPPTNYPSQSKTRDITYSFKLETINSLEFD